VKLFFYIPLFYILLFSHSVISNDNLDYNKWLKSEKFSYNLINKIEHLLNTKKLSKVNKKENVKEIQNQIISYLNIITEYQYEYTQLRSLCNNEISEINFDYFEKIEKCINNKNLKLLKKYSIPDLVFEYDNKLLIDNAEIFKKKFINLHTHEVKKENYDIIMENYYTNVQNINYNKFESQFNLLINFLSKKYYLISS
tara:strand:- start:26 stop:619 length:594 start_codon:yes stop_codon:yes gene_type:complete